MPPPSASSHEDALLNASAIIGLGLIGGGVLGYLFYNPCDGKAVLCGPGWGTARGAAYGSGAAAIVGAVIASTGGSEARTGSYAATGGAILTGLIGLVGAIRRVSGSTPAPAIATEAAP